MAEGPEDLAAYDGAPASLPEHIVGEEALYFSSLKCRKGVSHKGSVQSYCLNLLKNTVILADELATGKYKEGPVREIPIYFPKPRTALAIGFKDRSFQRSINDNSLYPQMISHFIYANYACQKGKGTDAARQAFARMLHNAYLKYGSNEFLILSADVQHYYDSMVHSITEDMFRKYLDEWTYENVVRTLNTQYKGDVGYKPGSQMVQIAGIAYLDPLDHYIKEKLRRRFYVRYMDDFHIIGLDYRELEWIWGEVDYKLNTLGMHTHPDKTAIHRAKDGVVFLGFVFRVTETGKVLMYRDPEKVKDVRRRMRRLANKIMKDPTYSEADLDASYQSVMACMEKGNSKRQIRTFRKFYYDLKKEVRNAIDKSNASPKEVI